MSILDYKDNESLGRVRSVDTATVVIAVDDVERLRKLQVNRLAVLQSSRAGQHLIGIIQKITRTALEGNGGIGDIDETSDGDQVAEINVVRIALIGTLIDKVGTRSNVFLRTLETVPEIDANCFALEGARLTAFMRVIANISGDGQKLTLGACPLGAIQDVVVMKPISLPKWLNKTLGLIPYLYLSLAVLFAATGTDFIICRYDPFVGIFRMDAKFHMVVLGVAFLLMGMFVARPYCRFLCPYGVVLSWMSRFSKWHLSITPSKCIQCKLCTNSCPFDAIDFPTNEKEVVKSGLGPKRFITYALIIPLWMALGVFVGAQSHTFLSKANPTVYLAELMISK
ncbi:MAG: 4Fe-4S binding protein, partial [Methyloversatilis sp.]|nr:4Fe-4S binding protein [Methyloversatilis sp.]